VRPGLKAGGLALTARAQAADVWVHETGAGGRGFTPTLDTAVPAGALAFLDVAGLDRALPRILAVARKLGVQSLLEQAGAALTSAGVHLRSLAPLLSGETAIAITSAPALTIVARTANEARARTALAALQAPLARALGTASTVPTFTQRTVAGVPVYGLRISPALELDYAVGRGRIAVSTGVGGIAAAFTGKGGLAGDPAYRAAVTGGSSSTTSILFLDLDQLLRLGAQLGLDQDPRFLAVRSDLRRVHAVGLTASGGEADTTAELSLQIP
jgi:hypothetical protein